MLRKTPLSGQLPPDKESASKGPEARRGARPKVRDNVMITVQSVGTGEQDEGDHPSLGGIMTNIGMA